LSEIFFEEASSGKGRGTKADATGHKGRLWIVGDEVFVDGDAGFFKAAFGVSSGKTLAAQVHQDDVVVCTPCKDGVASLHESVSQGLGIADNLLRVGAKRRLKRFAKSHGLSGNRMHMRASLYAWEKRTIEQRAHFFELAAGGAFAKGILEVLAHEEEAASGAAQGFVGSAGDHVTVGKGVIEQARCDQACWVGNVRHQEGAYFVGDVP